MQTGLLLLTQDQKWPRTTAVELAVEKQLVMK